ncbi:hypothetical protein [Microbacterium rhizomatis]|uniref:Uncharacterized protein n=1 Tax=Microbacterium rhizomatis TaxID=1631477 RepID=A0A5J5J4L9_9MICO|nr:hypothetical protein [Microbacterium rhizomatis]KAA9110960.1 hypothetical protein F6B43_04850 [Microbacterium rhizomatis]
MLDVALSRDGLRDPERVSGVLVENAWTTTSLVIVDTTEERSWRTTNKPGDDGLGASAWTTRSGEDGSTLGIIVEASSPIAAHALRDQIRERILAESRLLAIESDEVWSDGECLVILTAHEGSVLGKKSVPPTVQMSFGSADHSMRMI